MEENDGEHSGTASYNSRRHTVTDGGDVTENSLRVIETMRDSATVWLHAEESANEAHDLLEG